MGSKPPSEQRLFHVDQLVEWNDEYLNPYQKETGTNFREKYGHGPFVVTEIHAVPASDQETAGHPQILNLKRVPDGLSGAFFLPVKPLKI